MAPPPSFSLGLDPRVHTISATSHGCPDQVRAKRGEGARSLPNPHPELVEGRGFDAPHLPPSFDRLRMRTVTNPITNPSSSLRAAKPRGNPERDAHNPATFFSTKLIDAPQTPFILIPPFHITGAGATNVRGGRGPGSLGVASGKAKTVPRPACPRWQVYRGNPAGMGPSASKSTGHAKNPGCMRRCMSHLF